MRPNILTIAGSDSSGGAGIQADLKTIAALGGYGMSAITALTAQNTKGVDAIHTPDPEFLAQQLRTIAADVRIDAVKVGMLHDEPVMRVVADFLETIPPSLPVVVDPVMVATSGAHLLDPNAESALLHLLAAKHPALILTPNIPELAVLSGTHGADPTLATSIDQATAQAAHLAQMFDIIVVVKGGHLPGDTVVNAVVTPDGGIHILPAAPRAHSSSTHGTGCSFSSALATLSATAPDGGLAGGHSSLVEIVATAHQWIYEAIVAAAHNLDVGSPDNGPIDHSFATSPALSGAEALEAWWSGISPLLTNIWNLDFIIGLREGNLPREAFVHYQLQDALYLTEYSRALATASSLVPTGQEQAFWAKGAQECIVVERALHAQWVGTSWEGQPMDRTTKRYTDHLLATAARGDYSTLIAAVLPCYWIYQDVGEKLKEYSHPQHPYASWLDTYGDPGFEESTRQAKAYVARAWERAHRDRQAQMLDAFTYSSECEVEFFDRWRR